MQSLCSHGNIGVAGVGWAGVGCHSWWRCLFDQGRQEAGVHGLPSPCRHVAPEVEAAEVGEITSYPLRLRAAPPPLRERGEEPRAQPYWFYPNSQLGPLQDPAGLGQGRPGRALRGGRGRSRKSCAGWGGSRFTHLRLDPVAVPLPSFNRVAFATLPMYTISLACLCRRAAVLGC